MTRRPSNSDVPSGPVTESDVAQGVRVSQPAELGEDMTATDDISHAFLPQGVPEHHRATRRCENPGRWIPRPCNYVNPALDYAYHDWNTPGGVPGQ